MYIEREGQRDTHKHIHKCRDTNTHISLVAPTHKRGGGERKRETSSQGRVGRSGVPVLGWGVKPKGVYVNERAREKGKKEMTQKCETENSLSITYPIGVYIVHQM